MASSHVEYTSTTGTGPFSYGGIELLDDTRVTEQSQLVISVVDVLLAVEVLTYVASGPSTGQYTLNKTTRNVTLGDALISSDTLKIKRVTLDTSTHVNFTGNGSIEAAEINLALQQMRLLAQEAKEQDQET